MPDRVLPGSTYLPLLEVGEPFLDGEIDVMETHSLVGVTEDGDHDQLLVAEGGFRIFSGVDMIDRLAHWYWLQGLEDTAH